MSALTIKTAAVLLCNIRVSPNGDACTVTLADPSAALGQKQIIISSSSSNSSMTGHGGFGGTKRAAKKALGGVKRSGGGWRQLVDTTKSFETGSFRAAHALVLLMGVATLVGVHVGGGDAGTLLWFGPVWFLFLGLERLVHRRHIEQRSWAWLFNSWLTHWELLLVASLATSYTLYPRRRSHVTLAVMATVVAQTTFGMLALVGVSLRAQLGMLTGVASALTVGLICDTTGPKPAWAYAELGVTIMLLITVLALIRVVTA